MFTKHSYYTCTALHIVSKGLECPAECVPPGSTLGTALTTSVAEERGYSGVDGMASAANGRDSAVADVWGCGNIPHHACSYKYM